MDQQSDPHWEAFDSLVARFYPVLRASDGFPRETIVSSESRLGLKLPELLVQFYMRCGRREDLMSTYERVLPPEDLRLDEDVLVFVEENQGVSQWGIRLTGSDPAVERKDFTANPHWEADHDRLSEFLVSFVLWQAVNGGAPAGGVASADSDIFRAVSSWREFSIAGSHWTDTRFFERHEQLLCVLGKAEVSVLAATRTPSAFAELDAIMGLDWDYTWPETDD